MRDSQEESRVHSHSFNLARLLVCRSLAVHLVDVHLTLQLFRKGLPHCGMGEWVHEGTKEGGLTRSKSLAVSTPARSWRQYHAIRLENTRLTKEHST